MMMKSIRLACIMFCSSVLCLHAQWANLDSPTNINLYGTWFNNYDTGYAVGGNLNASVFLKTTNGGVSWDIITNTQTKWLYDEIFFNDTIGLACGFEGAIYKTVDAGLTWVAKPSETTMALYALARKPDGTIFAVGQDGIMIKSTNNGDNWNAVTSNTSQTMLDLTFYDNSYATAVGYNGEMIYTTDGGDNWAVRLLGTTNSLTGVAMLSPDTLWITTIGGRIYKSNNAGQSFYYLSPTSNDLNSIVFTDDLNGYIAGHQKLYQTIDGGVNWVEMTPYPTGNGMKDIFVSSDNRVMYAVGENGAIIKNINTIGLNNPAGSDIRVYPNPADQYVRIDLPGNYTVMLMDVTGRILKEFDLTGVEYGMIDVSELISGVYYLVINNDGEIGIVKVMVNH